MSTNQSAVAASETRGTGKFTALAVGLLVSVLGSTFTGFALGVWVFQETGSAAQYGLTLVMNFLPGILVSPVAGALVDRWSRWSVLAASSAVSATVIFILALLHTAGLLEPWHIFLTIAFQSMVRSVQVPALNSVVVLLVPQDQVARANGMVLMAQAIGGMLGVAVGGLLLVSIGLTGVLLIDCATYLFNIAVLLFVPIPRPPRTEAGTAGAGKLLSEIRQGWRYLTSRRGLVALALFYSALNLCVGYADVLITPVVLSFASAVALGVVLAFAGAGMTLGSLALTTWGGPRRRIHGLAGFALPLGLFLCLGALRPSIPLIIVAVLGFTFCSTIVDGTSRSILQLEVEPDMQGRVFASFSMVTQSVLCVSYALAGPVADHYFEPLLAEGGALAGSVGAVIGVGPGRGMAFLVLLLGLLMLVCAIVGYLVPSLRGFADRPSRAGAGDAAGPAEPAAAAVPAANLDAAPASASASDR